MKKVTLIFYVLTVICIATQCTQNPVFSDNVIPAANHWVKGRVVLSDSLIAKGAAVWLEGYDLGTFADQNGEFTLLLPPGGSLQDGVEHGVFRLFFYVGNYEMAIRNVVVINGNVATNQGDMGRDGFLAETVSLKKILHIETLVDPVSISSGPDTLNCEVRLTPTENDTIRFLAQGTSACLFSAFIRSLDKPNEKVVKVQTASMLLNVFTIDNSGIMLKLRIYLRHAELVGGYHEVIPFIILYQPYLPKGIKRLINYDFKSFNAAYLNIPYHRSGGRFQVTPMSQ